MTRFSIGCALVLLLCASLPAAAQLNGNIFTTNPDGTKVNGNLYTSKDDVYLTGGPKNCKNGSGLLDGDYYFQVTTPPGGTVASEVLSEDAITNRRFTVSGGYVTGYTGDHNVAVFTVCGTSTNTNPNTLDPGQSLGIQLLPYADTSNAGGEYKVWACKIDEAGSCTQVGTVVSSKGDGSCGDAALTPIVPNAFVESDSKTDNFKVGCSGGGGPVLWPISGIKFYDTNRNGVQDAGEPGIPNWQISLFASAGTISTLQASFPTSGFGMTTDGNGIFNTDNNPTGDKPVAGGVYGVCETIPNANPGFAWATGPACPKSFLTTPANFNYGGTFSDSNSDTAGLNTYAHSDVAFIDPVQYASGYALQYPVTATGGVVVNNPHLGIPYANCGPTYYNNIDDVFERTAATSPYGNNPLITFNDQPGAAGSPLFTDGADLTVSTWNHEYPGAVFGNYCKNTPAGGLTKGFWSNKNGASVLGNSTGAAYVDGLNDPSDNATPLHFVGQSIAVACSGSPSVTVPCAAGTSTTRNAAYLPTPGIANTPFSGQLICSTNSSTCLDYWLTNGSNSANAANQLSVQMVAAVLNINKGASIVGTFVTGPALTIDTYAYAPGTNCAAVAALGGYAKLGCVITEANTVLGLRQSDGKYAYAPSTSTATCHVGGTLGTVLCRTYETNLQNILNNVNNNIAGPVPSPAAGIALCGVDYTIKNSSGNPPAACSLTPIDHP